MCCATCGGLSFADLLRDPLIQLVMQSDGVTEQDLIELRNQVCRAQIVTDKTTPQHQLTEARGWRRSA